MTCMISMTYMIYMISMTYMIYETMHCLETYGIIDV